jgi:hypothetical protein
MGQPSGCPIFFERYKMKTYWSIEGPTRTAPKSHCIAFDKLDGSNLRFEWSRKRGWWKFGTRRRLFDENDHEYGKAISVFLEKYGDSIPQVFSQKQYKRPEKTIVFCEFYGPSSFAGFHDFSENMTVTLIDVAILKRGLVLPKQFVDDFGHLDIPKVIYEGNFNKEFIQEVKEGKYSVSGEGIVAKGIILGKKKNDQHGLWMRKVKTQWWLDELKKRAEKDDRYKQSLVDNLKEQNGD